MADPVVAQKAPYVTFEKAGKKVWCACGKSQRQPYCDGAHSGSEFTPEIVHLDQPRQVAWCGCKHSANKPYCDGSHAKL